MIFQPTNTFWHLEQQRLGVGITTEANAENLLIREPIVASAVTQTIEALRRYFRDQEIMICKNTNPHNPQKIHIWVTTSKEIDPEIELLARFDSEWWINQDPSLALKVLVRLR